MSPRFGVEYKLRNNFSLYNELGTFIPNVNAMSNNVGFLTKLEFKTYLNRQQKTVGPYASVELFYKHQSYGTYDSIAMVTNRYIKDYTVTKNVMCLTGKMGILEVFNNGLIIEPFVGIGIRNRNISSTLTNDENNNIQQDGTSNINILKNRAGIFNVLNLDAGIKIGYRLK